MKAQLLSNVAASWPNFFPSPPGSRVVAIRWSADLAPPFVGQGGSFIPLVDEAIDALRRGSPQATRFLLFGMASEADTTAHRRISFWDRHPGSLPDGRRWERTIRAGRVLETLVLATIDTLDAVRAELVAPTRYRRSMVLAFGPIDAGQLLEAFVAAADFSSREFLARHVDATLVTVATAQHACVLRPWIDDRASVDLFGPASLLEPLWQALDPGGSAATGP